MKKKKRIRKSIRIFFYDIYLKFLKECVFQNRKEVTEINRNMKATLIFVTNNKILYIFINITIYI